MLKVKKEIMTSRKSPVVAELVKMYGQPPGKPFTGNKPPTLTKPWEQKKNDQDAKPTVRSSFLNNNRSGSDAAQKFGAGNNVSSLNSSGSGSVPSWKRDLEKKNDAVNEPQWKQNQKKEIHSDPPATRKPWEKEPQNTGNSDPPWKKPAPTSNSPWARNQNRTEENEKPAVFNKPWMNKNVEKPGVAEEKPVPAWKKPPPPVTNKPDWKKKDEDQSEKPNRWKKPEIIPDKPKPSWAPKPTTEEPERPPKPSWQNKSNNEPPARPPWGKKTPDPINPPPKSHLHGFNQNRDPLPPPVDDDVYDDTSAEPEADFPPPPPKPTPPSTLGRPERKSFLHKPDRASDGKYQRKAIPPHIMNRPPPSKPSKPFNVQLPGRSPAFPPPPSPNRGLPSVPGSDRKYSADQSGTLSRRPLPTPGSHDELPPTPGARDLPPTPGARDFPLPVPPGASRDLPPLVPPGGPRDRENALPLPPGINGGAAPPLPGRTGPPLPPGNRNLPPPPGGDDIYDDTAEEGVPDPRPIPVRPPHPLVKQQSDDIIPTWDDEDDVDEALYDDTPETNQRGGMFPPPSAPDTGGDDFYEDASTYVKRKETKTDIAKSKEEEKKKKEAEKKEKDMRKKFKLPKEGEIAAELAGIVKSNSRGGGKDLAVQGNERVEIIRTKDNPKGKFLARNNEGLYGYVDSENISIDYDALKNTMQSARASFSMNAPAPIPPPNGPIGSPTIEEEAIYDETAEDLYEEL